MQNRGITLVALVITIIVLLILAGVSIGLIIGQNGILGKTQEAKKMTEIEEIKEKIRLDIVSVRIDKNGLDLDKEELETILQKYGTIFYEEDEEMIKGIYTKEKQYEIALNEVWDGTLKSKNGSWNGLVNTPKVAKGMIPIKWNGTKWQICKTTDTEWFDYANQEEDLDRTSKWANVMLSDGKYKAGVNTTEGTVVEEKEIRQYVYMDTKICI